MELALYCPVYGYYEAEKDTIGQRGDYFTSVSTGRLFGDLLAVQFADWLSAGLQKWGAAPATIVEAGAHDGRLAGDILGWLREHRRSLYNELRYRIVEPSARRREWQRQTLVQFLEKVDWVSGLAEVGGAPSDARDLARVHGVIFSNEFLDAFPVHRFGWDASQHAWFEWGVTSRNGSLGWQRLPGEQVCFSRFPQCLVERLPDGFVVDVCPAAENWWQKAAAQLERGKLVAIDYGVTTPELLLPERKAGTLRAYHQHHISDDLLARAGRQDLTSTVDWDAIQAAGEAAGLKTEALVSQESFLTRIAARLWQAPQAFGEWKAEHTRQFRTLTHPEHLGRRFSVLVQGRD